MVADQVALGSARERVLEAAERVVSETGAARLTLDAVAQAAGVSKGGLLYHFPSKESLLAALAQHYVDGMRQCIEAAKGAMQAGESGRDLKACIIGALSDPRAKAMGAAFLATAASDPTLLEVIRERIAEHTQELAASRVDFARAAIIVLAIDGLKMREALRISAFSAEQRDAIVNELLKLADEAHR